MSSIIISYLLFILPFLVLRFGISMFEIPKVIIFEFGVLLLFYSRIIDKNLKIPRKAYLIPTCMLIILGVGQFLFFHESTVFFGTAFRLQGVFLLVLLLVFSFLSSATWLIQLPPLFFIGILLFHMLIAFILGPNQNTHVFGALGESHTLAGIALFTWPFLLMNKKKLPLLLLIGCLITTTIVVVSGAQSAVLAFSLQLLILVLYTFLKLPLGKITLLSLFLLGISFFIPFTERNVYENRGEIWRTAWISGWESPIFGHGVGKITEALHETSYRVNTNVQHQFVDSTHNIFLDWWIQTGILGTLPFLFLLWLTFNHVVQDKSIHLLLMLIGIVTILSFNPASITLLAPLWWLIGQGENIKQSPEKT